MSVQEVNEVAGLLRGMQLVDLTPTLENDMPRFPTHPPIVINPTIHHAHDGYYCQTLFLPEHAGAHVDAPFHIHARLPEDTIDRAPVDCILGRAVVIDLASYGLGAGDYGTARMFQEQEERRGVRIQAGDIVLVNFGWLRRDWSLTDWRLVTNSPRLDASVADYLLERRIKALGSDTIACGSAMRDSVLAFCHIHDRLLPNCVYLMECLQNLEDLPAQVLFVAAPLKIKKGSGSPIRALAYF